MSNEKAIAPDNKMLKHMVNDKVAKAFEKYQQGISFQKDAAGVSFLNEMESVENKDVLIVSNYDVAYGLFLNKRLNAYLAENNKDFSTKFNYKSLSFITDLPEIDENLREEANVFAWPLLMLDHDACLPDQRFDVVICKSKESKITKTCRKWLSEGGIQVNS